ncbi:4-hydroxyproline epimerase [Spiribacter vilamensis]|uniref:Proline racemase n=1 Tax=Spiribacter vilamensis TaxID=531306 RepID=A0A4Q8D244_9GAMM|nr:4-hydroxyproline epimerase [Spiribacter vilamensis]RZU99357.1 proline racemase [Spiribacter vilamensis]TVO61661.1 4-hydroxyproline epimerase [Spiribacter vilamensis]
MARHTFFCIDGHTCGNPVRVVAGGGPRLRGESLSDYRQDFLAHHDWIRQGLMFEPRGHDMMSGSILYAPTRPDCELGVLFIETSGCLPMCGHGTIGTVTTAIEEGLVDPAIPGALALETPAGRVDVTYDQRGRFVESVSLRNVPAWLEATDVEVEVPGLGLLRCDIAYGGNFYAIFDPQPGFDGLDSLRIDDILRLSPEVRRRLNAIVDPVHPDDPTIHGVSHVMWTGPAHDPGADARNAVFYGDRAIDRSPCGTGTSARMAQLNGRGRLAVGDRFVHESVIGSLFTGEVIATETVGPHAGIRPRISGWARVTGYNTIFIDDRDPFAHGFSVN